MTRDEKRKLDDFKAEGAFYSPAVLKTNFRTRQSILSLKVECGKNVPILFIEGPDDIAVYEDFISKLQKRKFEFYICGNKKTVIELYEFFREEDFIGAIVDRDYHEKKDLPDDPTFYILPYYSIENLGANVELIDKYMCKATHSIYTDVEKKNAEHQALSPIIRKNIINLYNQGLELFREEYHKVHLLGYYYRKDPIYKKKDVNLPSEMKNINKLGIVDKKLVFQKKEVSDFFVIPDNQQFELKIDEDLKSAEENYSEEFNRLDYKRDWRGKIIFHFAQEFIKYMRCCKKDGNYPFSNSGKLKILELTLATASPYMPIPEGFTDFCNAVLSKCKAV
ncbi:DUF4435 domain-containing protein [Acetobacteraceae bacterium]|nr:DUF4435 domain-containing protein [Acetobacteraceae bacterium]